MIRPLAAALAAVLFALPATGADCDRPTRKALLAELSGAWFETRGAPAPTMATAFEVEVKGSKLRLWTVWLEDDMDRGNWVKGQRTGPNATLALDGPDCRALIGKVHHGLDARGLLSEDRREIRISYTTDAGHQQTLALHRRERIPGL